MDVRYTQVGPCPRGHALYASAPLRAVKVAPASAGPDVIAALDLSGFPGEVSDPEVSHVVAPGASWLAVTARVRTGSEWPQEVTTWQLLARRPGQGLASVARIGSWTAGYGHAQADRQDVQFSGLGIDGRGLVAIVPETVVQDGGGSGTYAAVVVVDAAGRAEVIHLPRQIDVKPSPDDQAESDGDDERR